VETVIAKDECTLHFGVATTRSSDVIESTSFCDPRRVAIIPARFSARFIAIQSLR